MTRPEKCVHCTGSRLIEAKLLDSNGHILPGRCPDPPVNIRRRVIAGLMASGMDLIGFAKEEDIAADIQERLKG
jgi:hypothetical protein